MEIKDLTIWPLRGTVVELVKVVRHGLHGKLFCLGKDGKVYANMGHNVRFWTAGNLEPSELDCLVKLGVIKRKQVVELRKERAAANRKRRVRNLWNDFVDAASDLGIPVTKGHEAAYKKALKGVA